MINTANAQIVGRGWAFPLGVNAQGKITLTNQNSEIEQAIFIVLSTPVGSRVMRPTFGSRLHELVFAPNNSQTTAQAIRYVQEALGMWEPRIEVKDVDVVRDPEDVHASRLLIKIRYEVKATHDPRSLVHPFYLIPGEPE
jgi:uncharacterized protein